MTKYDEQFKLSVVQSYEAGGRGFKPVAQRYGLDRATVRRWAAAYRQYGVSGLRKKLSHYTAEFKLSMLQRMQQEALSKLRALLQAIEQAAQKKTQVVLELRQGRPLTRLLKVAELSRSTFYDQARGSRFRLKVRIRAVYERHKGRYGYRRITAALRQAGERVTTRRYGD